MDNNPQISDESMGNEGEILEEKVNDDQMNISGGEDADVNDVSPEKTEDAAVHSYEQSPEPVESETDDISESAAEAESENHPEPEEKVESVEKHEPESVSKPDENSKKEKSSRTKMVVTLLLVIAVIALAVFFLCTHAILGNLFGRHDVYYSSTTEINLSGSDYKDYSQLSKVKSLEVIDLTNSSFSNLSDLDGCNKLQKVILSGKVFDAQDCIAFYKNAPEAHIVCNVRINGEVYPSDITQLKAEGADEKTQRLFAALVDLKELDMTGCEVNDDTYRNLSDALKECLIIIRTEICGTEYNTDAESVVLNGEISAEDVERMAFFSRLKLIDIKNCSNPENLNDFLAAHPDIRVNRPVELLGKTVGTEDEIADLRGSKYTLAQVKQALDEKLPQLKSLKKIDMCGCGLTNKEMEQLCSDYPDIKFVWIVHFKRWSVRTDAVVFSTLNGNGYEFYDQNDYAPVFKYCTDLIALDLGHSLITDISPIASMKNLRAVILTDNKIHNISAFSELKDLEFIEINVNRVESAEPLRDLQKLKYIDFWSSKAMTNLEPLYNHPELKLAIFHRTVSQAERQRFMKSNPDCDTYFRVDTVKTTTNKAWRTNPYRKRVKKAFKNWKYVVGFDEKTGEYIFDYNTDQYSIM